MTTTYSDAMALARTWDADPTITRIATTHPKAQAKRIAELLADIGAWFGLAHDGFGVWVPADRWPARVRATGYDDAKTTWLGTLIPTYRGLPVAVFGVMPGQEASAPYIVQMDPHDLNEWGHEAINPRSFDREHIEFLPLATNGSD